MVTLAGSFAASACAQNLPSKSSPALPREVEIQCTLPDAKTHAPAKEGLYIGGLFFGVADIKNAEATFDQYSNGPVVLVTFSQEAGIRFAKLTEKKVRASLPIYLDGALIACPTVLEPILGGEVLISGVYTVEEARKLAERIYPDDWRDAEAPKK
jgi:preprotein translocase subunit SecD